MPKWSELKRFSEHDGWEPEVYPFFYSQNIIYAK